MDYTTNLNLKKPAGTDNVKISDINENMDTLDSNIKTLQDKALTVTAGTWTPTATTGGGTVSASGNYYKIGKLVFVQFDMTLTANTSTDIITIGGFPFIAAQDAALTSYWCTSNLDTTSGDSDAFGVVANVKANTQTAQLRAWTDIGKDEELRWKSAGAGKMKFSGVYLATE